MPELVNLTPEELQAAMAAGLFDDPKVLDRLDSDSRQRFAQLAPGPKIGPKPADGPVTLGDIMDNPRESMGRIGAILKKDVTDPYTWAGLAAAYFGPKAFAQLEGSIAKAQAGRGLRVGPRLGAAMETIDPDLVSIASPRMGAALKKAQQLRAVLNKPAAEQATSPVESASGGTAPPSGPPPEPVPVARAASPKPKPVPADSILSDSAIAERQAVKTANQGKSPQQILNEEAIARRRAAASQPATGEAPSLLVEQMSSAELQVYRRLRMNGATDAAAKQAVIDSRQAAQTLNQTFGLKTPTAAETRFPKGQRGKPKPPTGSGS